MIAVLVAVLIAIVAAIVVRWRVVTRIEQMVGARLPVGSGGVITGAEGFDLPRDGAPAVLLLHGGGDTPQTLRQLANHLYAAGYAVDVPLLPGHGRTIREFAGVTADDWIATAREHYERMRKRHDWVAVVGLSMGGALAVQLAADDTELPALGLLAPYLAMPPVANRAAWCAPLWGLIVPYVQSANTLSVHDRSEAAKSLAYGVFSARALHQLRATVRRARSALPRVHAPTLVVQSREDNRIAVPDAEGAFAQLGAREKRLVWIEGAGHVITVDFGRDRVFSLIRDWLDAHRQAAPRQQRA
jgi:carboxylesterase